MLVPGDAWIQRPYSSGIFEWKWSAPLDWLHSTVNIKEGFALHIFFRLKKNINHKQQRMFRAYTDPDGLVGKQRQKSITPVKKHKIYVVSPTRATSTETIFFFTKKKVKDYKDLHALSKLSILSLKTGKTLDHEILDWKIIIYIIGLITKKYPYDKK